MSEVQLAVIKVKNEIFGVDAQEIKQIIKYEGIKKVQDMPDYIDGQISLRGESIPVINLGMKLGLGEIDATKKAKILLTEIGEKTVGFAADDVMELVRYSENEIGRLPEVIRKSGNSHVKSVGRKGDNLICILDLKSIIPLS